MPQCQEEQEAEDSVDTVRGLLWGNVAERTQDTQCACGSIQPRGCVVPSAHQHL